MAPQAPSVVFPLVYPVAGLIELFLGRQPVSYGRRNYFGQKQPVDYEAVEEGDVFIGAKEVEGAACLNLREPGFQELVL